MTWKEFKEIIDQKMVEEKVPEGATMNYIETPVFPTREDDLRVVYDPKNNSFAILD